MKLTAALSALILLLLPYAAVGGKRAVRNINKQHYRKIRGNMQSDVNPCVDFYAYACGNWKNQHPEANYYETVGFVDFKVNQEFAKILKLARQNTTLWQLKFVRNLYEYNRACMGVTDYHPKRYLKWLSEHENITWPSLVKVADSNRRRPAVPEQYDWLWMLAKLRKYGLNGVIVEETVVPRTDNAQVFLIDIDKPVQNGGFETMDFSSFALIVNYLNLKDKNGVQELWNKVQLFEQQLKDLADIDDDEPSQFATTLDALGMPWLERYLSVVLETQVQPHMEITIQNLKYFQAIEYLLSQQDEEFVSRFLMIRFMLHLHLEGPRNFLREDCIAHTRSVMPLPFYWLYERYHPETLNQINEISPLFRNLLQQFKQTLNENANSFSPRILRFLQVKANKMQIKFGNLPRIETTTVLNQLYDSLTVNTSDFYANQLRVHKHFTKGEHLNLWKTTRLSTEAFYYLEDTQTASSSSPYYLLRWNTIILPMSLLHLPVYDSNLHNVFKYSLLGFLLAHEITHGFDDSGVEVDENGNMRSPADSIKSNDIFESNLGCLRSKNPAIVDEKIADVSGLRLAYESFFSHANMTEIRKSLRWAAYSPKHLFFLNFAQFFCGVADDDSFDFRSHGPDRQRVLDTLANFDEFARVYECPMGSPMNPAKKCHLWR